MADELVGKNGCIVEDFYDVDGKGGNLSEHHTAQRVGGFEIKVLDDEVGALAVCLRMAVLARRVAR